MPSSKLGRIAVYHRGGGANGAFGAGALAGLTEAGVLEKTQENELVYCQGVSVGALNLASFVVGRSRNLGTKAADPMLSRWLSLARDRRGVAALFQPITLSWARTVPSIYADTGLKELIHGVPGKHTGIDAEALINSDVHFDVTVRREKGRRRIPEIVSNHDEAIKKSPGLILAFLQASASIAPFFPPVKIGGHFYSDGLTLRLRPAIGAKQHNCETIFLIVNDHPSLDEESPVSMDWRERAAYPHDDCNDDTIDLRLRFMKDEVHEGNRILQIFHMGSELPFLEKASDDKQSKLQPLADKDGHLWPRIVVVGPTRWIKGLGATQFTRAGIENGIEHGRERARAVLKELGWQESAP
jgi:predicted acylesterase/phospholipase RssA